MSWHTRTVNDYLDLLPELVKIVTSSSVATAVVNAGGTGYVVDDILTVVGGTFDPLASTIRVTSVSGGVVTGLRVETGGEYTVNPSLTANAVTGGTGTGATVDLTMLSNGWTVQRRTKEAVSATIAAGGAGYTVGDDLTLVGGLGVGTAAVFNVDTVSGGVVTAVSLVTAGDHEETPANPASTTGGTGTGCTLTVTYQNADSQEGVLILEGTGSGSDNILVGIKQYNTLGQDGFTTARNWSLHGFTAFNSGILFHDQAGISPGLDGAGSPDTTEGAFLPLKPNDSFPITYWVSVTSRRIILICKVEDALVTNYPSVYLGFMNQFGTSTEFPYPIYVAGSSSRYDALYNVTSLSFTGLTEVVGLISRNGPHWFRKTDNTWQDVKNSSANDGASPSRTSTASYVVYPCGEPANLGTGDDNVVASGQGLKWIDLIPNTGIPGVPAWKLQPTPDTGGDIRMLVPATVVASSGADTDIQGEIDDVFWFSGVLGVSSEDLIKQVNERYRVFQNGTRFTEFSFMAVKEA